MIDTVINKELGIQYPIFQGGMAWVADASLASGVSNAGGLGIIAAMNSNGEQLRAEIKKCKEMTDKPFGVNIMMMSPFVDEVAKVVVEEGVKVVTTGAGTPTKYMPMWTEAGIKVIPVVASVALARMFLYNEASYSFMKAYEIGQHKNSYKCYLAAKWFMDKDGSVINEDVPEEEYIIRRKIEQLMDNAAYQDEIRKLNDTEKYKNAGDVAGYHKVLDDILTNWKQDYYKYTAR